MTRAAWWHRPEVLDILAVLPRDIRIEQGRDVDGSYQAFADGFVSSLQAWREQAFAAGITAGPRVCDLVAAVTGQRLGGIHFLSDEPGLLQLADEVDAALADRVAPSMAEAA